VFLAASFMQSFPWTDWGLPNLAPLHMDPPDKTHLAPLRLLHALALVYVVLNGRAWRGMARNVVLRGFAVLGRHSLEVFSLGTVLGLIGRLAFRTYDGGWAMQVMVNVVGIGGMLLVAMLLERGRGRAAGRPAVGVPAPPRPLA
jgi:hypothetical protein